MTIDTQQSSNYRLSQNAIISVDSVSPSLSSHSTLLDSTISPPKSSAYQARPRAPVLHLPPPYFPLNGELLSHATFRSVLRSQHDKKVIRRILTHQLLRCQLPNDVFRIVAFAMLPKQQHRIGREIPPLGQSLARAFYRMRNNVCDATVLRTITAVSLRFKKANLPAPVGIVQLGLKFAARARSVSGMKRFLREMKSSGARLKKQAFRAVIAKCSVGFHGLGEIRNGRWTRADLLEVLLGFKDTQSEEPCHLETFLDRDHLGILYGWLIVLSRCKAADKLWEEWKLWLDNPARRTSQDIPGSTVTTRHKGDRLFITCMVHAGDMKRAWIMLESSGLSLADMRPFAKQKLLGGAEFASSTMVDDAFRRELILKYAYELEKIERALGVTWTTGKDGQTYHVPTADMEDRLEDLSSPTFVLEPDYGYPWASESMYMQLHIERDEERLLMEEAEEEK